MNSIFEYAFVMLSEIVTSKDDSQLVKKLTSFEKQISKLNKSVEKLTTYANEK